MNVKLREASVSPHNRLKHYNKQNSPAIFMLSDEGIILESNTEGKKLLESDEPGKKHISKLVPLLTKIDLLEEGNERVNPYLRFLSRIGHHFKVIGLSGRKLAGELFFSDIQHEDQHLIMIMIYPAQHKT